MPELTAVEKMLRSAGKTIKLQRFRELAAKHAPYTATEKVRFKLPFTSKSLPIPFGPSTDVVKQRGVVGSLLQAAKKQPGALATAAAKEGLPAVGAVGAVGYGGKKLLSKKEDKEKKSSVTIVSDEMVGQLVARSFHDELDQIMQEGSEA